MGMDKLGVGIFLILPLFSLSQTPKVDSLKARLSSQASQGISKVDLLNEIAFELYRINVDEAAELVRQSFILAKELHYIPGQAKSLYLTGVLHVARSHYAQGLVHFADALKLYQSIEDQKGISKCLNGMGITHHHQGNYDIALGYYEQSLQLDQEINDLPGVSKTLSNIGSIYSDLGNSKKAMAYYQRSLTIHKTLDNKVGVANSLNNLGILYDDQGDYYNALDCYNRALEIKRQLGDLLGASQCINNLGVVYKKLGNFTEALKCYERSLNINQQLKNKKNIAASLNNIGTVYLKQKNYPVAMEHYEESLAISDIIQDKKGRARAFNNIGKVKLSMGDDIAALEFYKKALRSKSAIGDQPGICNAYLGLGSAYYALKKYNRALTNLLSAEKMAAELNLPSYQRDIYELLSGLYHGQGNYKAAYQAHRLFKQLSDSLVNQEKLQKIIQLQYEHQYRQELDSAKHKEIKLIKEVKTAGNHLQRTQKQTLLTVIGFLVLTMILGAVIFSLRIHNIRTLNQNILMEQKLMRLQMTPHFMFNSLSILQGIILNREYDKSLRYLSKFSKLLRITLENSRDKLVSLESEVKAIENYLIIQDLGTNIPYRYSITIDPMVSKTKAWVPPMLIQPFVENAIEHGFRKKEADRQLSISITFDKNDLVCRIMDNGIGIDAYESRKVGQKRSLSTAITTERLQMLSKEFQMPAGITIIDRKHSNQQGTLVTIVLPYKTGMK